MNGARIGMGQEKEYVSAQRGQNRDIGIQKVRGKARDKQIEEEEGEANGKRIEEESLRKR